MRKLTLILLLIGISVICQGQNRSEHSTVTKENNPLIHKDGDAVGSSKPQKRLIIKEKPIVVSGGIIGEKDIRTGKPYILDSFDCSKLEQMPNKIKGGLNYLPTGGYATLSNSLIASYDYNFTKATIESNGKFTINLDGFKVTDTIWITAGKRKVGIPAYKFLEYFKDEPITIKGGLYWNGAKQYPTLNPQ
jgi:hypothetical protein